MASNFHGASPSHIGEMLGLALRVLPSSRRIPHVGERLAKFTAAMDVDDPQGAYLRLLSHWVDPAQVAMRGVEPPTELSSPAGINNVDEFVRYMMRMDSGNYLPDDIMVKVDRASMAVSLEGRVPFLDHRVFEFAASLPVDYLIEGRVGKKVLRDILYRYVPKHLVDRPKRGFAIPLEDWLRGPLRGWASDLLTPATLRRHGVFRPEVVNRYLQEHLTGKRAWHYQLWDVLMLTAWLDVNRLTLH